MSHSTKAPTKAERERMTAVARMRCICCEIDDVPQPSPTEVDHNVDKGYRKHSGGHMGTTPKCQWHHRGICLQGYQADRMKAIYGPSKALHHREFKARYGTDTELVARVDAKLDPIGKHLEQQNRFWQENPRDEAITRKAGALGEGGGAEVSETPINAKEAAEFLHIHEDTLKERARSGEIPGYKPARRWVFLRSELMEYLRTKKPECSTAARTRRTGIADLKSAVRKLDARLGQTTAKRRSSLKIISGGSHGAR